MERNYNIGIDIGSTTAKTVVMTQQNEMVFSSYQRHSAKIFEILKEDFTKILEEHGDINCSVAITGSAGLGLSEKFNIPFVQEVVAAAETVNTLYPDVSTLIDIGGEDSKIIFFNGEGRIDIRMNGSCAGGTGAFIDQMASLLNLRVEDLNGLASNYKNLFPIASRCGVFAKTDVQNLLSRSVAFPDIIASVFNAVAIQVLNTLARGSDINPKVLFCGGPFSFIPMLRTIFTNRLGLEAENIIMPDNPELLPAIGTALYNTEEVFTTTISEFIKMMDKKNAIIEIKKDREPTLFENEEAFQNWNSKRFTNVEKVDIKTLDNKNCFLGIDSGSTTSKMIICDEDGRVALEYYVDNRGDHVNAVREGIKLFNDQIKSAGINTNIVASAVTGYGEDLIKAVLNIDFGIVETIAHFIAAKRFEKDVSFILDIGGQDMKAMFIENGTIKDIQINEACSSGCGSFIQTFAKTLNYSLEGFSEAACTSFEPCNLGSRCTVFMNSRVKQFLREGATVNDIAAGLAYSVIRNCINKVLKISDMNLLGDHIVIQGGTFQNSAVHRAFEILTGKKIICPDISGHMGAYGAALYALRFWKKNKEFKTSFPGLEAISKNTEIPKKKEIHCKGCENFCTVNKLTYSNGNTFYSGNKCEKIFSNQGDVKRKGINLADTKLKLLFDRNMEPKGNAIATVGIPRVLNMFENFPFWNTLLVDSGVKVILSDPSTNKISDAGSGTVMSDNICYPAKLAHGHILNLCEKEIDRIFYPMVVYENEENGSNNSFNCPIVSGYPDVIRSAINPEAKFGIPLDKPVINFKDIKMLKKSCWQYLKTLGTKKSVFNKAFKNALETKKDYKNTLRKRAEEIVEIAKQENRPVIMLTGRPYHVDPQINHKIPELIASMGIDIITGDSAPEQQTLDDIQVLTWWTYSNRLYAAAKYVANTPHVELVQLNSFGCGPDAIATDEMRWHLKQHNKTLTSVRIDDIASPGSTKLRLRTMIESLKIKSKEASVIEKRQILPLFEEKDAKKKIIVPYFSKFHSPMISSLFKSLGYDFEVLPKTTKLSQDLGLKYTNNEICYPAILVIGDLIKALQSGKYDLTDTAVGITQTGGQCRASNYLSLIKKALISAGYGHIPIVSVNPGDGKLHAQPGFKPNMRKLITTWIHSAMMGDIISQMYYSTIVRAKNTDEVENLADYYIRMTQKIGILNREDLLVEAIKRMVRDFNNIEITDDLERPKIGVVGEIYAKYSEYANHDVMNWLSKNGIEVIMPPILDFFIQEFVNREININANLVKNDFWSVFTKILSGKIRRLLNKVNNSMKDFRYYKPFCDVRELSKKANKVLDLVNQYGEGWLLTGEFMEFAENGVENILCLQPFGCIANQVVAKGIEKRMKDIHPHLNVLYIDLDADTSSANYINRLHFLTKGAKNSLAIKNGEN